MENTETQIQPESLTEREHTTDLNRRQRHQTFRELLSFQKITQDRLFKFNDELAKLVNNFQHEHARNIVVDDAKYDFDERNILIKLLLAVKTNSTTLPLKLYSVEFHNRGLPFISN